MTETPVFNNNKYYGANMVMGPDSTVNNMNTKYSIEKLNGSNYLVWSAEIRLVLEAKGLWSYVDGTAIQPTNTAERETHAKNERQAMAEMLLNVEVRYVVSVLRKESEKELRDTLQSMNKSQAAASQNTLRRSLLSLKKQDTESIQEYTNAIFGIENELAQSGYTLTDFDKIYALLEGLPSSYDTISIIIRENERYNLVKSLEN